MHALNLNCTAFLPRLGGRKSYLGRLNSVVYVDARCFVVEHAVDKVLHLDSVCLIETYAEVLDAFLNCTVLIVNHGSILLRNRRNSERTVRSDYLGFYMVSMRRCASYVNRTYAAVVEFEHGNSGLIITCI